MGTAAATALTFTEPLHEIIVDAASTSQGPTTGEERPIGLILINDTVSFPV